MTTTPENPLRAALRSANEWAPQALDAALISEAPLLRDAYLAYALRHVQAEVAAVLFGRVDDETFERVARMLSVDAALAAPPVEVGEVCRFLVRAEDESRDDIHICGRTREQHPVRRRGRFENHENYSPAALRSAAPALDVERRCDFDCGPCRAEYAALEGASRGD